MWTEGLSTAGGPQKKSWCVILQFRLLSLEVSDVRVELDVFSLAFDGLLIRLCMGWSVSLEFCCLGQRLVMLLSARY